jgi:transposase
MSTIAQKPATTAIPVQLSEPEFTAFILPHLSIPKRGPRCKLGYHRVFHLILWVLYTGMQWKCLPIPTDSTGKPAIHYTTGYCWRTQKCRNLCVRHAFFEGKKAGETSPRKSTARTLKEVRQQYPTVYRVFAKWADDGSLWQAFVASVAHLAKAQQLDLRILHGDGTNTVAKKGGMVSATRGTNTRRATRSSRSRVIMAIS